MEFNTVSSSSYTEIYHQAFSEYDNEQIYRNLQKLHLNPLEGKKP